MDMSPDTTADPLRRILKIAASASTLPIIWFGWRGYDLPLTVPIKMAFFALAGFMATANAMSLYLNDPRMVARRLQGVAGGSGPEKRGDIEHAAISLVYLLSMETRLLTIRILLYASFSALFVAHQAAPSYGLAPIAFAPAMAFVVTFTKEQLLSYRVWTGLFGVNRYEARLLIDFVVENADAIDFGDGHGGRRAALLPELAKGAGLGRLPGQPTESET